MTAILYPVATSPERALDASLGAAVRESEARRLAGEPVAFVTGQVGPDFESREAALDAYPGWVDDERPATRVQVLPEHRFCQLVEAISGRRPPPTISPVNRDGRRWPTPPHPPRTIWRLMVTYWRPVSAAPGPVAEPVHPQARKARRSKAAEAAPETLNAMAHQPLRAIKPQQPLDIGLFEVRLPENPNLVMPDE